MLVGVRTNKDVIIHAVLIIRVFGWRTWFRALRFAVDRYHHTLLDAVMEQ
jgi:hypothetical protein